jgi:phosphoadenosine phosphosulfate reductase
MDRRGTTESVQVMASEISGLRLQTTIEARAADLHRALAAAEPIDIVAAAVAAAPVQRLAVVSSFGAESAVLLKFVADIDRTIPILFLDTGWLFPETLAYRDALTARLDLRDVRTIRPDPTAAGERDSDDDLWQRDPDGCCALRKVEPLAAALTGFDAWLNGRKRFQGSDRSELKLVEADGARLKFNPLANSSKDKLDRMFDAWDLPRHPLEAIGFRSIGCMPCTSRVAPDEDARAGRWRGSGKSECGIHVAPPATKAQPVDGSTAD